jgi:cysteine desulfurase/selenocysteine lyase
VFDLDKARRETPGVNHVVHLNNAGAALMPQAVLDAVKAHLELEAHTGGYEAARAREGELSAVYTSLARLLGCHPDEVAVVENATRAWDMAFYSIPFRAGDVILTSQAEYASNYIAYLQVSRRTGAVVEVIPDDEHGQVDVEALSRMLKKRVKLVSITHIPTNGGLVNPAAEIGRLTRAHGVLYLLDACQSVGQMPVDVQEIGCDLLSATSRKYLRGPRGVGFLYARREVLQRLEPPFLDLHAATWVAPDRYEIEPGARRFENWECNVAGKLGLGAAVDYALAWGLENTWPRVRALAEQVRRGLGEVPGCEVLDLGRERCGIISFTLEGYAPDQIRDCLRRQGINVNVSRAPSTFLDMTRRGIKELVRASVHYYNSETELERFLVALGRLEQEVRA